MNLAIFLLFALVLAIISIIRNKKSERKITRKNFIIAFAVAGAPAFMLSASDINMMVNGNNLTFSDELLQVMYVWFAVVAYPFFQRVCWRLNDAGAKSYISYVCLIPYLNIVPFIYLCVTPTRQSQ